MRAERIHGFTLIEMMIVVIVIGLLVAIAVPSYAKVRTTMREKQCQVDLELLSAAIRQLVWDTGSWPGKLRKSGVRNPEVWDLTSSSAGLLATDGGYPDWKGPYIQKIGTDPWGSPYFFDSDYRIGSRDSIVVGSFGPNRTGRNVYDADNIYVVLEK